ncbi:conserved hypothetical protein [Pediculus humanus corporis]|uniref:RCC1-like domain-containing protein n=1 Tax=Pediculus humanus subsp. corporis TaxID=121224 RepID=E0VFE2_PEDHC|nr:uncharacterized protein Phum_PHUM155370 [Pediculus humanus corporis]EEB12098.1 conserved hypothetical protein [Pediculus humanus corporis]
MSSKRKSDVTVDKSKKKVKKDESDGDEFDDENDSMSDASNNGADDPEDKSSDAVQEFLPGSEASEKLKEKLSGNVGVLLICGGVNWDLAGRKVPPKSVKNACLTPINLYIPHRMVPEFRVRLVATGCNSAHSVIITEEGKAMTFGQLGVGDTKTRDLPTLVESLKEYIIVGAATGRSHTLFLTERGTVFSVGDNKNGQLGIGSSTIQTLETPRMIKYKGPPIVKVDCGAEFSMILDVRGSLHSFGLPEYGQLGHNTDGQYFVNSNKLSFHCVLAPKKIGMFIEKGKDNHPVPVKVDEILDFSCGQNHTVAIDGRKRLFSWGFGGYGRLGHAEPKDEFVPRLIKFFDSQSRGVKSVYCGSSYTLAINDYGAVYLFGQTKRTGEANMYPKPLQDLSGWNVRSVGCSVTSIVVAADESVIAWGPSPTHGELGIGELRRSSTVPVEVKTLDGIHINQVACGIAHTLFIARDSTEAEKEKINKLYEFQPGEA